MATKIGIDDVFHQPAETDLPAMLAIQKGVSQTNQTGVFGYSAVGIGVLAASGKGGMALYAESDGLAGVFLDQ